MRTSLLLFGLFALPATAADPPRLRIALVGDSTVTAAAGWGDGFTARLSDRAEVLNLAAGGRSSRSFIAEGRWAKCLDLKPDYALIQFGHNDQKPDPKLSTDPATTYREFLTRFVTEARAAGIKPVLVTSLSRRQWRDDGTIRSTLIPYADAARAVATEAGVPVIDLHARSVELYERLGRTEVDGLSPRKAGEIDHTHLNVKGSEVVGRVVAEELARAIPELAPYLKPVQPLTTVDLWPAGKMPGDGAKEPEADRPPRGDNVRRVTNISRPTLAVFPAPKAARPAPAVIVCPGGGYGYLCIDKEGTDVAAWLNAAGVTAVVLKYRAPNNRAGAFQDVQRAVSVVRANAAGWNVDPARLGVMGFSAGGHLAAKASTRFGDRSYPAVDATDDTSCRPDFAVLVYPAYLADKDGRVPDDLAPPANGPPLLIVHSEDDTPHVPGSKAYHAALTSAKVPHEFKLYPTCGHGYGLHSPRDAKAWPEDTLAWMKGVGMR